jgi:toxin ParE1/3/4
VSLVIHPRADLDQFEIFSYLAKNNPRAARRFLDSLDAVWNSINSDPARGHRYLNSKRSDEDWRYVRVPGFESYFIFYRLTGQNAEVVRIVHGSRDLDAIFRVL